MTTYFEYGVNLTYNQKRSLASAMNNHTPLTLRLKNGNLTGNDELMLTKTQLKRIQKSLNNGTGADIKISKTQIRKVAKQGVNLFSSLASLGARVLPYAVKGLSKAVPALATGAVSALGSLGIDKIFGNLFCANISSVENALKTVQQFSSISGLSLNVKKTKAIWLGKWEANKTTPLNLKWVRFPTKVLGVYVSFDEKGNNKYNFTLK